MLNHLQRVFEYHQKQIRMVLIDDQPWFVAKDVCEVLEIDSTQTRRLDDDEKGLRLIQTPGGPQEMLCINEAGLYSLILGSRKPEAKEFKRWVTHEVIPAIRQTGGYIATPASLEDLIIMQAQSVKELKARVSDIEEKAIAAHHRIDNLDAINIIGDPQQRLNAMVRKYAHQTGVIFSKAWGDFTEAYNTAYHTNLKMLIANYQIKQRLKHITIPQYLAATGKLEDGIRVADKLLNQPKAG